MDSQGRRKRTKTILASLARRECRVCHNKFRLVDTVSGTDSHLTCSAECAYKAMKRRERRKNASGQ